jgi:hypothetical protein
MMGVARDRVQVPGICLIIVGILNLLVGLLSVVGAVYSAVVPAEQLAEANRAYVEMLARAFPAMEEPLRKQEQQQNPEEAKMRSVLGNGAIAAVHLLCALLVIFGGARMMQLRSFGLCLIASLLAATPCISPTGCCCLGNIAGIYAAIVLLSAEVRMAFLRQSGAAS